MTHAFPTRRASDLRQRRGRARLPRSPLSEWRRPDRTPRKGSRAVLRRHMVGRRNRAGHPRREAVLHARIPPRRAGPGARHAAGDVAMIGWFKALDMGGKAMVIVFALLLAIACVGTGIHLVDTARPGDFQGRSEE